jgi:hypothetical protein
MIAIVPTYAPPIAVGLKVLMPMHSARSSETQGAGSFDVRQPHRDFLPT